MLLATFQAHTDLHFRAPPAAEGIVWQVLTEEQR